MTLRSLSLTAATVLTAGLIAGCATGESGMSREAEADERLAEFTATGETRSCLSTRRIDQIEPLDDTRWLVTELGGNTYLNEVSRGCSNAARAFTYIEYQTPSGRLCRGEIVRVRDQSTDIVNGSCGLGEYQELEPVESEG